MILGGVPFYLQLLNNNLSLSQNIDELCFSKKGMLKIEFDEFVVLIKDVLTAMAEAEDK